MRTSALTEAEWFPGMTEDGRRLLRWLRERPSAPRFTHQIGDRLTAEAVRRIRSFEAELQSERALEGWRPDSAPNWVGEFVAFAYGDVPFYRRRGSPPSAISSVATTRRADVDHEPWALVPDSQPLEDLIVYTTSGTHGRPLSVLSLPETSAHYLPLIRWALQRVGVNLEGGPGRVALIQVCAQRYTFTFPTIATYLDQAGMVKVNLNPAEWRDPADRAVFLDECRAEIYAGDPIAFAELLRLPLRWRPKAMLSTSMNLDAEFASRLAARFECPILNMYALTEAGPIGVEDRGSFLLFPRRLYVEAVRPDDTPCQPNERGELVVTGGFNPMLSLLRYRTSDYGRVEFRGSQPVLTDLDLRPPTIYRAADGHLVNNIDVTMGLQRFGLDRFEVRQFKDGAVAVRVLGIDVEANQVRAALSDVFGANAAVSVTIDDKIGEIDPRGMRPEGRRRLTEHSSEVSFGELLEVGLW